MVRDPRRRLGAAHLRLILPWRYAPRTFTGTEALVLLINQPAQDADRCLRGTSRVWLKSHHTRKVIGTTIAAFMLGSESASTPRPQPSAKLIPTAIPLGLLVTWCPEEFMQGALSGRSSSQLRLLASLFQCTACVHQKCGGNQVEDRRFSLMVNFTLLSVVVLLSLTLMLLVLPVVLPPLPPPPPFLMLVPVVIFVLLMLIAFVPSGFNAIVVSYV